MQKFWLCMCLTLVMNVQAEQLLAPDDEVKAAVERARAEDRSTLVVLSVLCSVGLFLPLPLALFHLWRVQKLSEEVIKLRQMLLERDKALAVAEQLRTRNEKLETELKRTVEKHRNALKIAQEKYDLANETIEKLKKDFQRVELENKRLSGILLLKEQGKK
ncbi:MAG: hypothetical protein RMM17_12045 [Acidobacteriota bacterium]|nr:hypothetical protein [Blastocatellia bacterium]MDW8413405.1 hypothetical protein [Acidobacteriota bacterium]